MTLPLRRRRLSGQIGTATGEDAMDTGSTEDRLAIRELIESYCHAVNVRDAALWGANWAEDAEWNLPVVPGMERVTGREAIVAAWVESMALFPFVNMMAMPGVIRVDGDRATVTSYTSEVAVMRDGTELRPRGCYEDVVVRRGGRWLFQRRSFRALHGE
jgi:uncharacterized protein (TIGR02246 family)